MFPRDELKRIAARMVLDIASATACRKTAGQRALDAAVMTLHDEGEIEVAVCIGIIHGMRVLGPTAVAVTLKLLIAASEEMAPRGTVDRITESN